MTPRFASLERLVQRDRTLRFRTDDDLGVVVALRGALSEVRDDPRRAGLKFLKEHRELFGDIDPDSLVVLAAGQDATGADAILEQRHGGFPVLGASVRFHVDRSGRLDTVSNRLFPDLAGVPRQPKVTRDRALRALRKATWSQARARRQPEVIVVRHRRRPHLAWQVHLDTDASQRGDFGGPVQWIGYVDAVSGQLLYRYNNIQTSGPVSASGSGYYSGAGSVNAWDTGTAFQLRDTTRTSTGGPEIHTHSENGAPSEDPDGDWNAETTSPRHAHQGPEVDAHRFAGNVVDYYRDVHGRSSFDGAGATLNTVVHRRTDPNNGWWDGSQVNLGDGTGTAPGDDYVCSADWLAHEWTHAYTQLTCGLVYNGESGALNEAFSDVMAAFITGDWLVFEDTWLQASAPAYRNMVDPTNGGSWNAADAYNSTLAGHQPSHYSARYTGLVDSGGVHINSGIINNLFYLLTVGATHTVSGVTVSAIGQTAAEKLLWRCMTVHLVGLQTATFLQFREAMLDACLDLFPTDLFTLSQTKAAFNAVGIGPDVYLRDNLSDTGAEPLAGGYLWASPDIVNRTSPSTDPAADFADLADDSLSQNVAYGQDNYVYVRLQNRGAQAGDATVNVYLSPGSTFGTPASWIHVGTTSESAIAPGSTRITSPIAVASGSIPASGDCCMIALVSSTLDPAPDHNLISSLSMYLDHVRATNNIAYRNVNIAEVAPAGRATAQMIVRGIGDEIEGWALRIDDEGFVGGARIVLRGPREVLENAAPRGLKLIGRDNGDALFELLRGRDRRHHLGFDGLDPADGRAAGPGFDRLRITRAFTLRIDFELPDRRLLAQLDRPPARPTLTVLQYWRGEAVGANTIRLRPRS